MTKFKVIGLAICLLSLVGCATYTLNGKQYTSIEAMRDGREADRVADLAQITSLSQPVSSKRVVVAEPSRELKQKRVRAAAERQLGRPTTEQEHAQFLTNKLIQFNLEPTDIPDFVRKKGIYREVEVLYLNAESEIPASSDRDVIQFEDGQWIFRGHKTGRQLLTFDNSKPTRAEKVEGMLSQIISAALLNK